MPELYSSIFSIMREVGKNKKMGSDNLFIV